METEHQRSAGGLVVRGGEVLLISLQDGRRWQIPKGHVEDEETAEAAAVREVREETGVTGRPLGRLPSIEYWFVEGGKRIHKRVDFYLLDYVEGSAADFDPREVSGAGWFGWPAAVEQITFDNERRIAEAAWQEWRRRSAAEEGVSP